MTQHDLNVYNYPMNNLTNQDMIKKWSRVPVQYMDNYGEEGDLSKKYLLNPVIFRLLGEINEFYEGRKNNM